MFYNDFDNPKNNSIIDLEKYKEICKVCDEILLSPEANEVTVAIPILHVIREHPVFLKQYESIFDTSSIKKNKIKLGIDFKTGLKFILNLFFKSFSATKYWHLTSKLKNNYDYVFVSHLLNESQVGESNDFYFGNLPNLLSKKGYSVLVVLFNHISTNKALPLDKWDKNIPRIILSNNNGLINEIGYFFNFISESKKLIIKSKDEKYIVKKNVLKLASNQLMPTINNLRIYYQFFKLAKIVNAKKVIITYEGHGSERLIFSAFKKNSQKIKCIGYQHALIFKEQYAIKRLLKNIYNPDLIYTSGESGKIELKNYGLKNNTPIVVLGSNRVFDIEHKSHNLTKSISILVIPEAIFSECILLFEFSLICAKQMPNINFIWRLHPLMNFNQITSENLDINKLPSNIILSNRTIKDDINSSNLVLYRGSTAVINAVIAGLRPIYLNLPGEMTIDPLYQFDKFKTNVSKPLDLINTIKEIKRLDSLDNQISLIGEIKKIMTPFNINELVNN
jgi:hypothetical protein